MNRIANQLNELVNQTKQLATNLNMKGVSADENETLNTLVPKVLAIVNNENVALGEKEINEDGEYYAYKDDLDGYSKLNVNVLGNSEFIGSFSGQTINNTNPKNIKMLGDVPNYAFMKESVNEADLTKANNIGISAFNGTGLKNIISPNPLNVDSYAFCQCSNLEGKIIISEQQTEIKNYSFYACTKLKTVLHDGVTKINDYAFYNNFENDMTALPSSLESIGNYAFFNNKIKITELPQNVKTLGNYAFRGCAIETLKVNNDCTSIGQQCFRYSNALSNVEIGTGMTLLNAYCFADTALKKITIHRTKPPTIYSNAFYNCPLETIEVPASTLETYKKSTNWSNYADIMIGIEGE